MINYSVIIAKNKITAILLILISFLGLGLPKKASSKADESVMRVMSFNIRCGEVYERMGVVPSVINEYSPDTVGVQECTYAWYKWLKFKLTDYEFVGVGRDTGDLSKNCGEISGILYKKDKFSLIDSGTFWLSETPDEVSFGWDADCRRVCTWAVLEEKETGKRLAHVNTHLDHVGAEARTKGLKMVTDKAESFDIPTVVTGDFNFSKGSALYNQMVSTSLTDSAEIAKISMQGRTFHAYSDSEEGAPIDFILMNEKITDVRSYAIVREKINNIFTSDHYPIFSDYTF